MKKKPLTINKILKKIVGKKRPDIEYHLARVSCDYHGENIFKIFLFKGLFMAYCYKCLIEKDKLPHPDITVKFMSAQVKDKELILEKAGWKFGKLVK